MMELRWGRVGYLASVILPIFEHVYDIVDLRWWCRRAPSGRIVVDAVVTNELTALAKTSYAKTSYAKTSYAKTSHARTSHAKTSLGRSAARKSSTAREPPCCQAAAASRARSSNRRALPCAAETRDRGVWSGRPASSPPVVDSR
jgi:hypothetical protein